jgi:nitrate reductase delta subunit
MAQDTTGHLYRLFADLLEYPTPALARQAQECSELLSAASPQAAALLKRFRCFVEQAPAARLEELYTGTFDLQAVCYPYVGYHLFGESYKRGMFMAQLNEGYRERGFSVGNELPDHVAVVLRFLALAADGDFSQVLLREGLIPTVDKMAQAFGDPSDNPYAGVIRALLLALNDKTERGMGNG